MNFNEYQEKALLTAIYRDSDLCKQNDFWNEAYCALQLASEAGEVAGKYAKIVRKGEIHKNLTIDFEQQIKDELGDVLWYIANLADLIGFTLEEIAERNIEKLKDRSERGVLHGNGDNR